MDVLNGLDLTPGGSPASPTRSPRRTPRPRPTSTRTAGGGGGWTQIGATANTTSGSAVAFTAIPAIYWDLMLVFEGVSHNNGSSHHPQDRTVG